MLFREVIGRAKKGGSFPAASGQTTLRASIDEKPSYQIRNTFAAFRSEIEDILGKPVEVVGGGAGCVYVHFDLTNLDQGEINELETFVSRPENKNYFKERYNINSLIVSRM